MIAKCDECHHEWQAVGSPGKCDWCGGVGRKIATDYTELLPRMRDMLECKLGTKEEK